MGLGRSTQMGVGCAHKVTNSCVISRSRTAARLTRLSLLKRFQPLGFISQLLKTPAKALLTGCLTALEASPPQNCLAQNARRILPFGRQR